MRTLVIRDAQGGLSPSAFESIVATIHFHDDDESRAQAFDILKSERARAERIGFESWSPTALTQSLINRARGKVGQRSACGYTALALFHSIRTGKGKATVYSAANIVCRAMKKAKKKLKSPLLSLNVEDGEWVTKSEQIPSSQNDIQKAHRAFEPVSHIIAAEILCMDYFELSDTFGRTENQILAVLATAACIERTILSEAPDGLRNHYRIDGLLPVGDEDFPAFELTDSALALIDSGMQ